MGLTVWARKRLRSLGVRTAICGNSRRWKAARTGCAKAFESAACESGQMGRLCDAQEIWIGLVQVYFDLSDSMCGVHLAWCNATLREVVRHGGIRFGCEPSSRKMRKHEPKHADSHKRESDVASRA